MFTLNKIVSVDVPFEEHRDISVEYAGKKHKFVLFIDDKSEDNSKHQFLLDSNTFLLLSNCTEIEYCCGYIL